MPTEATSGSGEPPQRLLAIVGPTGSGKSDVAMAVCEEVGGEIVSCDSVQVYRGFDIGSAKPTARERARVAHHVIDVADWDEPFDAQRYRELALAAVESIRARGRVPVLCGGTGLYLRALRWGLMPVPAADEQLRAGLLAEEYARPGTLYARLRRVDPETAAATEPHNLVRIVRALEIHEQTGIAASTLRARHGFIREHLPMRVVALAHAPTLLRRRIDQRSKTMLELGLREEVERLLAAGVSPECRPMRAVGYRQVADVLLGASPEQGLARRIAASTWAYARRQRTWLRRERDVEQLEVPTLEQAVQSCLAILRR